MKRILALILCLVMLFPFVSCAKEETPATIDAVQTTDEKKDNEKETEEKKETATIEETKTEEKEPVVYNAVNDPLTWDDINAIPIANNSMSSEQLRQICVDFFNLSMTFTYVPNQDYHYVVESQNFKRVLPEGELTGGIPYITIGYGNLYRLMDHYDSNTGILDMTPFLANPKLLGNACSGGASYGWARAINSVTKFQWTWGMTHANGFLKVGPYEYDLTLTSIGKDPSDYGAPEICKKNGKQVMFESYAAAHKADGTVNTGHVRMITEEPIVVRKEDGTIDGDKSFLVCSDQICYNTVPEKYQRTQADGTKYHIAGGNNWKYSFNELYNTNYIPFTFAEFLGTDPVEDAEVIFTHKGETVTPFDVNGATLTANYIITDIYFKIKDAEGNYVLNYRKTIESFMKYYFQFSGNIPLAALTKYADGNHTLELSVQLGNGTRPVFYTGKLMPVK
ncbi:MAG: hypothetical protein IKJ74_00555 [Clostridia bacterium]|nr:hypothetical protein [Clostridia bacterium]